MSKTPRKKKSSSAGKGAKSAPSQKAKKSSENARKGTLVEAIVALLHDLPGVKVERNVELPPKHGDQTRRREIDVLLTSHVAGYPVRIAFSCKNERKKIEPGAIGEFIDELDDVGIPPQQGIFVCVNGYTSGALDRAKEKGIRTLVLKGLSKDRLTSEIAEAFQFTVYLLAEVAKMSVTNEMGTAEYKGQYFLFFDDKQRPCGSVLDLVLSWWQHSAPTITLGEHNLDLDFPQGWHQFLDGKPVRVLAISATVKVRGLIIVLAGKLKQHALIDPLAQTIERSLTQVEFDLPRGPKAALPLKAVNTEEELKAFTHRPGRVRVTSRIKLPRILCGPIYYPVSERVARLMRERFKKFKTDEISNPSAFTLEEMEGTDLSTAWEPPWYKTAKGGEGPPVIVMDDEGENVDLRLLMRAREYGRVIALRPKFERNPTPEFARLLYWAYLMQASVLTAKAKTREGAAAKHLLEEGIEKIKAAIEIIPDLTDAYINLGSVLRELERYEEAVSSYNRAIELDKDNHEAWWNRTVPLIDLGKLEDALDSVNKSVSLATKTKEQVKPLLLRAYVHHLAARHSDAANDLVAAWKINADEVIEDANYHSLVEALGLGAQSPETMLLLTELYWGQAASEAMNGNSEEAKKQAENAVQILYSLKPPDSSDETLIISSVPGDITEDVLIRSAGRLVKSCNVGLARENIEKMQT